NGASITAIKDGKSMDTSMGLTPVEGLIMGTRSGDVDAGVLTLIMEKEEIDYSALNTLLNKHSGVLGVSGISSDMREVESAADEGDERALLSLRMYEYRVRKYIGAYAAAMGGVDVIIFTGGIGENGWETRENICRDFGFLGMDFDKQANEGVRGKETIISTKDSKVTVMVVPTNEEYVIASDTLDIVEKRKHNSSYKK
ncbi:MAG TPA: acetate kinase, partial [Bacteroidales bacterium]|nr:acetate kinase [Bacteroidales bacterium]